MELNYVQSDGKEFWVAKVFTLSKCKRVQQFSYPYESTVLVSLYYITLT